MNSNNGHSLTGEIRLCFDMAAMNREARLKLSGAQWQQYRQMDDDFARERKALNAAYAREYETRVEMARRRLIDQAGSKNLDFKHRVFGRDAFDTGALSRQAQRDVRVAHDARLMALDKREHWAKENFLAECVHRQSARDVAVADKAILRDQFRRHHPQRTR